MVTKHGERRIRERLGINKRACRRQSYLARSRGISRYQTEGMLKNWIDKHAFRYESLGGPNSYVVYNNSLFVYSQNQECLITVLSIPTRLHKYAERQIKKREANR